MGVLVGTGELAETRVTQSISTGKVALVVRMVVEGVVGRLGVGLELRHKTLVGDRVLRVMAVSMRVVVRKVAASGTGNCLLTRRLNKLILEVHIFHLRLYTDSLRNS